MRVFAYFCCKSDYTHQMLQQLPSCHCAGNTRRSSAEYQWSAFKTLQTQKNKMILILLKIIILQDTFNNLEPVLFLWSNTNFWCSLELQQFQVNIYRFFFPQNLSKHIRCRQTKSEKCRINNGRLSQQTFWHRGKAQVLLTFIGLFHVGVFVPVLLLHFYGKYCRAFMCYAHIDIWHV